MTVTVQAEGVTYTPTPRDVLWLARAVAAEGPPYAEVARALVSGFLWARARRGFSGGMDDWIRAYSQPLNPRWAPGGDLYEDRMQRARSRGQAELAERYERQGRRRAQAQRRVAFPDRMLAAVEEALAHGTHAPVTDFAAWWAKPDADRTPLGPAVPGQNRFFTRDPSWTGYEGGDRRKSRQLVASVAEAARGGGLAAVAMLGLALVLMAVSNA